MPKPRQKCKSSVVVKKKPHLKVSEYGGMLVNPITDDTEPS